MDAMDISLKVLLETLFKHFGLNSWNVYDKGDLVLCMIRFKKKNGDLEIQQTAFKKVPQSQIERNKNRADDFNKSDKTNTRKTRASKKNTIISDNVIELKRDSEQSIDSTPVLSPVYVKSDHNQESRLDDPLIRHPSESASLDLYADPGGTPSLHVMDDQSSMCTSEVTISDNDSMISSDNETVHSDHCKFRYVPPANAPLLPSPYPDDGGDENYDDSDGWCYHQQCVYGFGYVKPDQRLDGFKFQPDVYVCDLHDERLEICQRCMDNGAHEGHRPWMKTLTY